VSGKDIQARLEDDLLWPCATEAQHLRMLGSRVSGQSRYTHRYVDLNPGTLTAAEEVRSLGAVVHLEQLIGGTQMLLYCELREEEALAYLGMGEPSTTYPRISLWREERVARLADSSSLNRYLSSSRGATSSPFVVTATVRRSWFGVIPA
jgi:hypothetical protein